MTGRWLNRDPIEPQAWQRYVSNDPINRVDLLGGPEEPWHHVYPLYLGGSNGQLTIQVSPEQHVKIHQYLASQGLAKETPDAARARWKALSPIRQGAAIRQSLEAAGLNGAQIKLAMRGADFMGATPGIGTQRCGKVKGPSFVNRGSGPALGPFAKGAAAAIPALGIFSLLLNGPTVPQEWLDQYPPTGTKLEDRFTPPPGSAYGGMWKRDDGGWYWSEGGNFL
jgi:hypothetical protein